MSERLQRVPQELVDWTGYAVRRIWGGFSTHVSSLHDRVFHRFRPTLRGSGSWRRRETTSHGLSDGV
uniref:Uncharacterized protein n=1 Tax=uncultured haloarchaeon TaxID=160804 RepID=A0A0K1YBS1_9EURY|nr:hypothetical protein [uncultured haloarchaeon]